MTGGMYVLWVGIITAPQQPPHPIPTHKTYIQPVIDH